MASAEYVLGCLTVSYVFFTLPAKSVAFMSPINLTKNDQILSGPVGIGHFPQTAEKKFRMTYFGQNQGCSLDRWLRAGLQLVYALNYGT